MDLEYLQAVGKVLVQGCTRTSDELCLMPVSCRPGSWHRSLRYFVMFFSAARLQKCLADRMRCCFVYFLCHWSALGKGPVMEVACGMQILGKKVGRDLRGEVDVVDMAEC